MCIQVEPFVASAHAGVRGGSRPGLQHRRREQTKRQLGTTVAFVGMAVVLATVDSTPPTSLTTEPSKSLSSQPGKSPDTPGRFTRHSRRPFLKTPDLRMSTMPDLPSSPIPVSPETTR